MDEASICDNRVVIRCSHCHLNQFETKSGLCRKCHKSLPKPDRQPPDIGFAIKLLRLANGMSKLGLARKSNMARQKIGMFERNKISPNITTIERLAAALNATPYALVTIAEACG